MPLILIIAALVLVAIVAAPFLFKVGFAVAIYALMQGWIPVPQHIDIAKARASDVKVHCTVPIVPSGNKLVVAEVHDGEALADVTMGPYPADFKVVHVHVGWGFSKVTAFLVGSNVIWDFDGSIDRLAHVYVPASAKAPAGVRGLPADLVSFPSLYGACNYRHPDERNKFGQKAFDATMEIMFGRKPNRVAYAYKAAFLDLTWARFSEANGIAEGGTKYYPGGLIDIDPATLVSNVPANDRPSGVLQRVLEGHTTYGAPPTILDRNGNFIPK